MTKLYRSRRDSKLTGLCGGLAEQLNVDPTLLRLVVVVTAFFSAGTIIPIYIIAAIVIPKEPFGHMDPPYGNSYGGGRYGRAEEHYRGATQYAGPQHRQQQDYYPGSDAARAHGATNTQADPNHIDEMMKDVEKKAMKKEIEELRAKVAKYEKGE